MNKNYSKRMLFNFAIMLFFGVFFLTGTFNDEDIASSIFSPDNLPVKIITSTGVYPFFASYVFFLGALAEQESHSGKNKPVRVLMSTICVVSAILVGFIGSVVFFDVDCLGTIFPSLSTNMPVIAVGSLIGMYPLFFLGYHLAGKSDDKLLLKKLKCIVLIMLMAFIAMQGLKSLFHRPRYRTVVLGYEGIGFVPWYKPFHGVSEFVETLGIRKGEFRSFPSGHGVLSISMVYVLESLTWFFPKLKNRGLVLCLFGFLFGTTIMLTRMILGAHYLSDVSAGAMIGTLLSFANTFLQHRIAMKSVKTEIKEEESLPDMVR